MTSLPRIGETINDFTVTELGTIHMLSAGTVLFNHESSGAQLLYIQDDDRELDFNLICRTPQPDERDSSHILEHLILSSCQRYPGRGIFFDMDNKDYTTFMNGLTDNTFTCYPVRSQSQKQLVKLMDVLLCCMEKPDTLKDKHLYLREAIRYKLSSPRDPLTMQGTILSEDWDHLTDILENADSVTSHTLYQDMRTASLLGRAHLHHRKLSYRQTRETFEQCYSYSNCLITLYGNMDYRSVLHFLGREHLPGAASKGRSLLGESEEPVKPGLRTCTAQSPAYQGSPSEHASVMDYGIDLSDYIKEELIYWDLFADILDDDTSPWHKYAREMGINHVMEVYLDILLLHLSLKFRLHNGDSCLKEAFLGSIKKALEDISRNGLSPKLYRASMEENRLSDFLTRETPHLGFNLSEGIGCYRGITGRTDYFRLYEEAFRRFEEDPDQSIIKKLAASALQPAASALVVTEPVPGLAERMGEGKEQYPEEKPASTTAAEQKQLIEQTTAFHDWNFRKRSNMDFLIGPGELPELSESCPFTRRQWETIACYTSPTPSRNVGSYQLYFDVNGTEKDDLNRLTLYQMLLIELDTKRFTVERQKNLEQGYLHDCTFDELYPPKETGTLNHPMMSVFQYGLTKDFEVGLNFLLGIMGGGSYIDMDTIVQVLEKYLPDYGQLKADNASALTFGLSEGYMRRECRFHNMLNGQENYYFLKDVLNRLKEGPDFEAAAAVRLETISHTILNRRGLVFLAAASPDVLGTLEQTVIDILGRLPGFKEGHSSPVPAVWFPDQRQELAVYMETSCQETRLMGDFHGNPGLKGRYLPFLMAVVDKCLKPTTRYQGGAYGSGIDFYIPTGYFSLWSIADPEVRSTVKLFLATGAQLIGLPLTHKELDGYILSAYAQALLSSGTLNTHIRRTRRDMVNMDIRKINEMISDIRNVALYHQKRAALVTDKILGRSAVVTMGNGKCTMRDKDMFDQVLIYHVDYV